MAEGRMARRLVAILAADVVGYSRLMGADEEGTLAALKAVRSEVVDRMIGEYQGRIVKTMGDGLLVEFASAVEAVRCALEVQRAVDQRNVDVAEDRRIAFRIGINVGDIIIDHGDVFGDGVNIAARLEPLAEPGGICLSDNAYQQVRGKLPLEVTDMGERQLKNIAEPVRVHGIGPTSAPPRPALPLPDRPSIAVLPFQNMSGDHSQDYFADGMVDDIITGLSRIKWLFVIARNSTFTYKGRAVDVKQVGRELGVRYVLEGSVRKQADRVRVTGQLIDATTGMHLWADRYDRKSDDIFELQDEVTLSVVSAIEPRLRQVEMERVKRKRPDSLDAYDLVLRALANDMAMPEGIAQAVPFLERALALEADYARAHGYLSLCHHSLYLRAGMREENLRSAIRHAHAAIDYGQDDNSALTLGGFVVAMDEHDRPAAYQAFDTALALSPSSAFTYLVGCVVFGWAGKAEQTIEWAERAIRLSPFDSWIYFAWHGLALGHFSLGHYEEAVNAARKAVYFNPGFSMNHMLLAASLGKLGQLQQGKGAAARILALQPQYRYGKHFAHVDCEPALAAALGEGLNSVDLPE